jgi:hypothetical protein
MGGAQRYPSPHATMVGFAFRPRSSSSAGKLNPPYISSALRSQTKPPSGIYSLRDPPVWDRTSGNCPVRERQLRYVTGAVLSPIFFFKASQVVRSSSVMAEQDSISWKIRLASLRK